MMLFKSKFFWYRVLSIIGIWVFIAAIVLKPHIAEDYHKLLSGGMGLGALMIGFSIYMTTRHEVRQKDPELARKQDIEMKDERNTILREKALANANKILIGAIFAILIVLSFFTVPWYFPVTLGLLLVIDGVFFVLYYVYYNKRI